MSPMSFTRALPDFKRLVIGDAHIEVITDDDKAIKKAAASVFPQIP